jgi:EAL domain-containing protein (putative c-di-GMP-specific phosphodiesterase class I)
VLNTACAQCSAWQRMGHRVRVGINLSSAQLQSNDLAGLVTRALARTSCPPDLVELEVTEDILLMNAEPAVESFRRLQDIGVMIAFDDFGTGYASMSHLKNFPLNTLKIDKSFVMKLWDDPNNLPIVSVIIVLGKSLGLSVIAEGVEDDNTAQHLAAIGCDEGQGYHFSRPVPAAEFERKYFQKSESLAAISA